jgi:thioredoxin-dependent peroxiredoxin
MKTGVRRVYVNGDFCLILIRGRFRRRFSISNSLIHIGGSGMRIISSFVLATLLVFSAMAIGLAKNPTEEPAVGTAAPDFSLTSNEGHPTSLKDFRGKWIVLYFYPKDFTGGCTLEAHNFQRDADKYQAKNAVILGVSVDTAESHKSFCAKEGLSFKLLSDADAKVSTEYGSLMDFNGTKLSARNTFIIDPKGKIAKVYTGVKPSSHSEEVLSALEALQKG